MTPVRCVRSVSRGQRDSKCRTDLDSFPPEPGVVWPWGAVEGEDGLRAVPVPGAMIRCLRLLGLRDGLSTGQRCDFGSIVGAIVQVFDVGSTAGVDSRQLMEVDLPRTPPFLVWVDSSGAFGINSDPGLLLAWRRTPESGLGIRKESEWQCLVISATEAAPTSPESLRILQRWMNPAHARPVDAEKPPPPPRRRKGRARPAS